MSQLVISFKSEESAKNWMQRSDELGQQAYEAMKDTAAILTEIKAESRGSLVDEFVDLGNHVLEATNVLTHTFAEMSTTINKVVTGLSKFVDDVTGGISAISKVFK